MLLLQACQTPGPREDLAAGQSTAALVAAREARLERLDDYRFSGGIGFWTQTQSQSGRVDWDQAKDNFQLKLTGPLGVGEILLQEKGGSATLWRGSDIVASGAAADDVVNRSLGQDMPVPLRQLKYWVLGLPGDASTILRDAAGKLQSIRYMSNAGNDWEVRFKKYITVEQLSVPALITASDGSFSVRLVLKKWQFAPIRGDRVENESNKRLPIPGR